SVRWVRRHRFELPLIRIGRLIRFDHSLLSQLLQERILPGKSLRPERKLMLSRYQRGYVYLTGRKVKVWYGMFREDIQTPEGQVERRQSQCPSRHTGGTTDVGRVSEEAGRALENSKSYGNGFPRAGGTLAKGCGADDESQYLEPLPKRDE